MLRKTQRVLDPTDVAHTLLGALTHLYVLTNPVNGVLLFSLYMIYQYFSYREKHDSLAEDILEFVVGFAGASVATLLLRLAYG